MRALPLPAKGLRLGFAYMAGMAKDVCGNAFGYRAVGAQGIGQGNGCGAGVLVQNAGVEIGLATKDSMEAGRIDAERFGGVRGVEDASPRERKLFVLLTTKKLDGNPQSFM